MSYHPPPNIPPVFPMVSLELVSKDLWNIINVYQFYPLYCLEKLHFGFGGSSSMRSFTAETPDGLLGHFVPLTEIGTVFILFLCVSCAYQVSEDGQNAVCKSLSYVLLHQRLPFLSVGHPSTVVLHVFYAPSVFQNVSCKLARRRSVGSSVPHLTRMFNTDWNKSVEATQK